MTGATGDPAADPAVDPQPNQGPAHGNEPDPARTDAALLAVLLELERHSSELGWDGPPRLFALVHTAHLQAEESALVDALGLSTTPGPADALTAVEQDGTRWSGDLLADLADLAWTDSVHGCALAVVRTFLPAGLEVEVPLDSGAAAAYVAEHPDREEVRVVVGVDRAGNRHGVARVRSLPTSSSARPIWSRTSLRHWRIP